VHISFITACIKHGGYVAAARRAAAQQFAEIGAKLVLVARRADRLQALKLELEKEHKVMLHRL